MSSVTATLKKAVEHHQQGRLAEAERLYRQVLLSAPKQADAINLLGLIAHQTGHLAQAIQLISQAVTLEPANPKFRYNLANVWHAKCDPAKAAAEYEAALKLKPDYPLALNGLGLALRDQGILDRACDCFEQAMKIDPTYWDPVFSLATTLEQRGDLEKALACYETAHQLRPTSAMCLSNLGNLKFQLKRYDVALDDLERAIAIEPGFAVARLNLGNALLALKRTDDAIACFRRTIELAPDMAEAHNSLGRAMQDLRNYDEQIACCERALQLNPSFAQAMVNLGVALRAQGRSAEAMAWFIRAHELKPDDKAAASNVLFTMILLPDYDMAAILEANRGMWKNWPHSQGMPTGYANSRESRRRLRLGYVSGDFRQHSVAHFMTPVLAHHDKSQFEVFCYYNHATEDQFTQRLKTHADNWRDVSALSDSRFSALVLEDWIDILVDLSGHTALSRITAFATRPAPIQVTYMGYPATTGLEAIDYRLTDAVADPPGIADEFYTEKLWRLDGVLVCYEAPADMPEPGQLPALGQGTMTFGSFNSVNKLGPAVISNWARILKALAGSRLVLTSVPRGHAQERLAAMFEAEGVDSARLKMVPEMANAEFLQLYREVDIALDSFPCGGGTSTCESLWMGVPVVSLLGKTFAGRVSASMLAAIGRQEWCAHDMDEYVGIALGLAADLTRLAAIRADLRNSVANSPLGDATGFTRNLEKAYREMWASWCLQN